ncbi:cobalamin-dependent protein [Rhodoligotrophos defluvii]|uniref:cobalamin-dependent protein n=1 Tax=Rhodoligotrophos defluvii TaxID=2561934 RepID=UPI0010C994AF|nr:cobalamin-dependent protein [Rhodoligotrophos defluvii]
MSRDISGPVLDREQIFPEGAIDGLGAFNAGIKLAGDVQVGRSAFLEKHGLPSELAFKRREMAAGRLMFHAQIGYRSLEASKRAWAEIHDRLDARGGWAPDRYGICLDWSMGYARRDRARRRKGTGLILDKPEDFMALTAMAPVAPHFGDFVLGMPAAVENTSAALLAGATTIGNLSQYFTFRLPDWHDDVGTTLATVEALGLLKGQSVEILVHSNLDDGYAAWVEDMGTALGCAMIERWIVEDLMGLPLGQCFGHTFTDPVKRLAFKMALARANPTPGTMLYGNTTLYRADIAENYAALCSYIMIDMIGQLTAPTGHAVTPIPVTEAQRIPDVGEIVDAHMAAHRLAERLPLAMPLIDDQAAAALVEPLEARARSFMARALSAFTDAGINMEDPAELLLAMRRIGPGRLEAWYADPATEAPKIASAFVDEIEELADEELAQVPPADRQTLTETAPVVVIGATDVHFYGKRLIETMLRRIAVEPVDGGVSVEPAKLAEACAAAGAQAVCISTYNGVALSFVQNLKGELARRGLAIPIYVGGRLNEVLEDTGSDLPSDVAQELRQLGAQPCSTVRDFLSDLAARRRESPAASRE